MKKKKKKRVFSKEKLQPGFNGVGGGKAEIEKLSVWARKRELGHTVD